MLELFETTAHVKHKCFGCKHCGRRHNSLLHRLMDVETIRDKSKQKHSVNSDQSHYNLPTAIIQFGSPVLNYNFNQEHKIAKISGNAF